MSKAIHERSSFIVGDIFFSLNNVQTKIRGTINKSRVGGYNLIISINLIIIYVEVNSYLHEKVKIKNIIMSVIDILIVNFCFHLNVLSVVYLKNGL